MTTYHSFSSASWPATHLVVWKSIMKVLNQKFARRPKCCSSLFFIFSFRQACSKLWLFHDGFHIKLQHFALSSAPAYHFFITLKSHEAVQTDHWRTMASLTTPFCKTCTHAHKSLSNETIIIQNCWIRNTVVCIEMRRVFSIHCWLSVNRAWSMILQPILHTSTE